MLRTAVAAAAGALLVVAFVLVLGAVLLPSVRAAVTPARVAPIFDAPSVLCVTASDILARIMLALPPGGSVTADLVWDGATGHELVITMPDGSQMVARFENGCAVKLQ